MAMHYIYMCVYAHTYVCTYIHTIILYVVQDSEKLVAM